MPRDFKLYLQDILDAVNLIAEFVGSSTFEVFRSDTKTVHAVVRDLEVIGEAVKKLPDALRDAHPEIPWKRIAGLRDILIHHYYAIDVEIVWDVVQSKLPELKICIQRMLDQAP